MKAPHPQEIPGGVWQPEAALWEMDCVYTFASSVQAITILRRYMQLFSCICATLREMARVSPSTLPPYRYKVSWELREA